MIVKSSFVVDLFVTKKCVPKSSVYFYEYLEFTSSTQNIKRSKYFLSGCFSGGDTVRNQLQFQSRVLESKVLEHLRDLKMADKPMIEKTVPDEPKPKAEGVGTYFEWFKDKD